MGNSEVRYLAPVRDDERQELNLSHTLNYKQYCRHVEGRPNGSCLQELPWHIRDCLSFYESMNASFNVIQELPYELPMRLPHLRYLNLSHNQLKKLPDNFGLLFHLQTLILKYNHIQTLPDSVFHLVKLVKLDLSHNRLKFIQDTFTHLESLAKLNISYNRLKSLPISLGGVKTLKVVLASYNRLSEPCHSICESSSEALIMYLRKSYNLSGISESLLASSHNVFARVRGNSLHSSVPNLHSAQVQYIQSQTHTNNTASRIKTPLLPPQDGSLLEASTLTDRIIGLIYGAAIGDAIGLATTCMSADECQFHYEKDSIEYTDIVQDEIRVRWSRGDWTSNFDTLALVLDSLISWAGVVDELDYAKRLRHWSQFGCSELGDQCGIVLSETVKQVIEHPFFLKNPHYASQEILSKGTVHVFAVDNGQIHNEDEYSKESTSGDESSDNDVMPTNLIIFPSSHPCIPSLTFGTDNGAIVEIPVLGIPYFHLPQEVEANTIRICKTTHCHPLCIGSCVLVTNLISHMLQGRHDLNCSRSTEDLIRKAQTAAEKYISDPEQLKEFSRYVSLTSTSSINVREQCNMSYSLKAMSAGLVALRSDQSFKSFLMNLLMEGGDSNSNCIVAGALLGCKLGYSHLPQKWIHGLNTDQTAWLNVKINHLLDMIGLP